MIRKHGDVRRNNSRMQRPRGWRYLRVIAAPAEKMAGDRLVSRHRYILIRRISMQRSGMSLVLITPGRQWLRVDATGHGRDGRSIQFEHGWPIGRRQRCTCRTG